MSMRLMKTLLSCNVIQRKKWEKLRHGFLLQLCCSLCILRDLWFIFAMIIIINVIGVLGSSVEEGGEYPSDPGGKVTPLCKRLGLRWNTVQCETLWNTVQCRFGSDFLASSPTLLPTLHHRLLMPFLVSTKSLSHSVEIARNNSLCGGVCHPGNVDATSLAIIVLGWLHKFLPEWGLNQYFLVNSHFHWQKHSSDLF